MAGKMLGVIGGLGPMATVRFLELVTRMTEADRDQDHVDAAVFSCPSIPDRTASLLDPGAESPLPKMAELAKTLEKIGASCIAIPCITAHSYWEELSKTVEIPVLNALEGTAEVLESRGITRAGLLATRGTIRAGAFQKVLNAHGIRGILPKEAEQEALMDLIYGGIKAEKPVDLRKFHRICRNLRRNGAETLILGCTELSLLGLGEGYVDTLEVLAAQAVTACGGRLKKPYENQWKKEEFPHETEYSGASGGNRRPGAGEIGLCG